MFALDTLSRLKGMETLLVSLFNSVKMALDTLSRLKGMETHRYVVVEKNY